MEPRRERSEDVNDIIDRLEDSVAAARGIPLTGSCLVDREEMLILVSAIRENLPAEIKQAAWMLDQNRQLIAEARKEAEAIRRDAEAKMTSMIDEHEITERARKMAAETVETANGSARQIRAGAMDYAKKKLSELEEQLTEILVTIQRHKKELK
jgi:hypothetical protein